MTFGTGSREPGVHLGFLLNPAWSRQRHTCSFSAASLLRTSSRNRMLVMTVDQLRRMHQARPFQPFEIYLADGRSIAVDHPELLAISLLAAERSAWQSSRCHRDNRPSPRHEPQAAEQWIPSATGSRELAFAPLRVGLLPTAMTLNFGKACCKRSSAGRRSPCVSATPKERRFLSDRRCTRPASLTWVSWRLRT